MVVCISIVHDEWNSKLHLVVRTSCITVNVCLHRVQVCRTTMLSTLAINTATGRTSSGGASTHTDMLCDSNLVFDHNGVTYSASLLNCFKVVIDSAVVFVTSMESLFRLL